VCVCVCVCVKRAGALGRAILHQGLERVKRGQLLRVAERVRVRVNPRLADNGRQQGQSRNNHRVNPCGSVRQRGEHVAAAGVDKASARRRATIHQGFERVKRGQL